MLINKWKYICYPYYLCLCAHNILKCRESGCSGTKQMVDKGPSGKGSGIYITGMLIIRMHFIVT